MDPHIRSEETDSLHEAGKDDDAANYLRRLRATASEGLPAAATAACDEKTPAAKAIDWKERRQSPRLRCSGSAEFRAEGSDVRMWGTITDVSLHGCYVEMTTTFPIDTKVELVLKSCGIRIQTLGTVRASYPSLGMGICFTDIEPAQHANLKQLLAALGGRSIFISEAKAQENAIKDIPLFADPRAVLDEIAEFFRQNQQLSRDEFHNIAKRLHRS